jgi:hypothetical protein
VQPSTHRLSTIIDLRNIKKALTKTRCYANRSRRALMIKNQSWTAVVIQCLPPPSLLSGLPLCWYLAQAEGWWCTPIFKLISRCVPPCINIPTALHIRALLKCHLIISFAMLPMKKMSDRFVISVNKDNTRNVFLLPLNKLNIKTRVACFPWPEMPSRFRLIK